MSQSSDTREYTVQGMTCGHCVLSVCEEVSEIAGVQDVDVDLASGRMTVSGENLSDDAIRAAVDEAGWARGYSDEQITEVVGLVALRLLTGASNLVAGIEPAPEARAELTTRSAA